MSLLFSAPAFQLFEKPGLKQVETSTLDKLGPVVKAQTAHDQRLLDRFTDRPDFDAVPLSTILAAKVGLAGNIKNAVERQTVAAQWAEGGVGGAVPIDKNTAQTHGGPTLEVTPKTVETFGVIPIRSEDRAYRSACVAPRTLLISKHGTLYICDELGDLVLEALPIADDLTSVRTLLALNTRALTENELQTVRELDEREAGQSWAGNQTYGASRRGYDRATMERIDAQNTIILTDGNGATTSSEPLELLSSSQPPLSDDLSLSSRRPLSLASPPPAPTTRRLTFLSSLSVEMNGISIVFRHMEAAPVMPEADVHSGTASLQGSMVMNESFLAASGSFAANKLLNSSAPLDATASFVANGSMNLSRSRARSVLGDAAAGVEAMLAAQQLQTQLRKDESTSMTEIEMYSAYRFVFANAAEAVKFATVLRQFTQPDVYQHREQLLVSKQRDLYARLQEKQRMAIEARNAAAAAREEARLARHQRRSKSRGMSTISNSTFGPLSPDIETPTPRSTLMDLRSSLNDDPQIGRQHNASYGRFDHIMTPPNVSYGGAGDFPTIANIARPSLDCPVGEDPQAKSQRLARDEQELVVLLNALLSGSTLSTPLSVSLGNSSSPLTGKADILRTRPPSTSDSATGPLGSGVNAAFLSKEDQHAADLELNEMMKYAQKSHQEQANIADASGQVLYPNFSLGPHFEHLEHMERFRKEEHVRKEQDRKAKVQQLALIEQQRLSKLKNQKLRPILKSDGNIMMVEEADYQQRLKEERGQQIRSSREGSPNAFVDGTAVLSVKNNNRFAFENHNGEVMVVPTVDSKDFEIFRRKAQLNILQSYQGEAQGHQPTEVERLQKQMKNLSEKQTSKMTPPPEERNKMVGRLEPPQHYYDPNSNLINVAALSASIPTQNPAIVSKRAQIAGNTISLQAPYPNFFPKYGILDHSQHKYTTMTNRQEQIEYETFTRPQLTNALGQFFGDVQDGRRWVEQQKELDEAADELDKARQFHQHSSATKQLSVGLLNLDPSQKNAGPAASHEGQLTSGSFADLSLVRAVNNSIVSHMPASFALSSGQSIEGNGSIFSAKGSTNPPQQALTSIGNDRDIEGKALAPELTLEGTPQKISGNHSTMASIAAIVMREEDESTNTSSPPNNQKRRSVVSLSRNGELSADTTSIFAVSMESTNVVPGDPNIRFPLKASQVTTPAQPNSAMWSKHVTSRPDFQAAEAVVAKLRNQLGALNGHPIHTLTSRERLKALSPQALPEMETRRADLEYNAIRSARVLDVDFQNQIGDFVYNSNSNGSRPRWMTENVSYSPQRSIPDESIIIPETIKPPILQNLLPPPPPPPPSTMTFI